MKHLSRHIFMSACAAVVATGGLALTLGGLTGCKNSTDASTGADAVMGPPPVVEAHPGSPTLATEKPDSPSWGKAVWQTLVHPGNNLKKTAPTRVAIAYDATHLYVAVVAEQPVATHDVMSVFLDTRREGKEYLEIKTGPDGNASATWYRATIAPVAKEDGSPSYTQPLRTIPNLEIRDLSVKTWVESQQWSAVFSIPLKKLPETMQTDVRAGETLRMNCLRITQSPTSKTEFVQSNLSKVFQGAQSVSPYRMAEVRLVGE